MQAAGLAARGLEQVVDHLLQVPAVAHDGVDRPLLLPGQRAEHAVAQQRGPLVGRRQRRAQLVRNMRQELVAHRHLPQPRLVQLPQRLLVGRDVAQQGQPRRRSLPVQVGHAHLGDAHLAVRPDDRQFGHRCIDRVAERPPRQLAAAAVQQGLGGRIREAHDTLEVGDDDGIDRAGDQALQALLGPGQFAQAHRQFAQPTLARDGMIQ